MTQPQIADETRIRQQIDTLVHAIRSMDLEGVKSVYAPDIVSFDVQPPLQHVGAEAKWRNWAEAFTRFQRPLDYEVRDLAIVSSGDVAFTHSLNRLSGTRKNGSRSGFWVRVTCCFRQIDGRWLIAHDHASAPLDPESGSALLDLEP